MNLRLPALPLAASILLLSPIAHATIRPHRHSSSHAMVSRSASSHATHTSHFAEHAATVSISPERATQIQAALIQRGYLNGEPTGTWDSASSSAMQKLQSDNGWQTKLVPDSRALIKLGLGPGSMPDTAMPSAVSSNPAESTPVAVQAQTF